MIAWMLIVRKIVSILLEILRRNRLIWISFKSFFAIVGFLYLIMGCTVVNQPDGTLRNSSVLTPTPTYIVPVTSEPDPLDGTRWELVAFERAEGSPSLPEQPRFFVEFQQGEVSLWPYALI